MDPAQQQSKVTPTPPPILPSDGEKTIAKILLDESILTVEQYNRIKNEAINSSISIDKALTDSKMVPESVYFEARAKLIGVPFVAITSLPFSPEAISMIPKAVAER